MKSFITQGGGVSKTGHKRKSPEPYDGKRDDKVLENFIFYMERYLKSLRGFSDEEKLDEIVCCLSSEAKLWWRTHLEDQKAGRPVPIVNTWDDLCTQLKQQFKSESADLELRYKFRFMR